MQLYQNTTFQCMDLHWRAEFKSLLVYCTSLLLNIGMLYLFIDWMYTNMQACHCIFICGIPVAATLIIKDK